MAKKKKAPSKLQKEYNRERKRVLQFINRASKRGYDFPQIEDIIPNKPDKIKRSDINLLKKFTPEKLYEQALIFVTPEGEVLSVQAGREYEAEKRRNVARRNLISFRAKQVEKKNDIFFEEDARGIVVYDSWKKIKDTEGIKAANTFLASLSEEDQDAFTDEQVKRIQAEEDQRWREQYGNRTEPDSGRQNRKDVYADEGPQSQPKEYIDVGKTGFPDESESEGFSEDETRAYETEEDIKERLRKQKAREDAKAWRDKFLKKDKTPLTEEEARYKAKYKKGNFEAIYDGYVIIDNMYERIARVEGGDGEHDSSGLNIYPWGIRNTFSLKSLLNHRIASEGKDDIAKRLQGYGMIIDTLMDIMMYDSNEQNSSSALTQLAELINGAKLSQQEMLELEEAGEILSLSQEVEDYEE